MDTGDEIVPSQRVTHVPVKIIKHIMLTVGKVISMSLLINQKSTFRKQNGLSGKALMEKVLVETYNISKNKTKV